MLISTSLCSGEPAVGIICTLDNSSHSVVEIEEELQVVEAEEEGAHIALVDYNKVSESEVNGFIMSISCRRG